MNKNTIKKYKKAFDSWLEKDEVLCRYKRDDFHEDIGWMRLNENVNFFSDNCIFILNDFAVELRKAIAEHKTIQFWKIKEQHQTYKSKDTYEWIELRNIDVNYAFEKDLKLYRIKELKC